MKVQKTAEGALNNSKLVILLQQTFPERYRATTPGWLRQQLSMNKVPLLREYDFITVDFASIGLAPKAAQLLFKNYRPIRRRTLNQMISRLCKLGMLDEEGERELRRSVGCRS